MIKDISIMVQPQDEKNESEIKKQIVYQLKKDNISFKDNELTYIFQKKSIDARHGQIKLYLKYKVFIGEKRVLQKMFLNGKMFLATKKS